MIYKLFATLTVAFVLSCTSNPKDLAELNSSEFPSRLAFMTAKEDPCIPLNEISSPIVFAEQQQVVVRMVGGECKTFKGKSGYKKSTPWLVMGFPCSKDQAGIEWKGSYYRPDKVQFSIKNSCAFSNSTAKEIETYAREKFKISKHFPFLAYVPLDTQYWELSNYPDQDLGINVELVTNPSRSKGWTKFRKGAQLDLVLYGTENAWMKEKEFYRVEASLLPSDDRVKFSIKVKNARSATEGEISQLKANCQKIIPSRPCEKLMVH